MPVIRPNERTVNRRVEQDAGHASGSSDPEIESKRPTLPGAVIAAFRLVWDRLGLVVGVSLTWGCILSVWMAILSAVPVPALLKWLLAVTGGVMLCIPVMCGACAIGWQLLRYEDTGFSELIRTVARGGFAAIRLGLINGLVVLAIGSNLWFYGHLHSALAAIMFVVVAYVGIVWLLLMMVQPALLYAQETGMLDDEGRSARRGALAVVRRSFYLVFGAPAFVLGMFMIVAAFGLVTFITAIPYVLFWLGMIGITTASCVNALLIRLGALEPPAIPEPPVPDEEFRIKTV